MVRTTTAPRTLEPGTTGWLSSDLDDPAVAAQWDEGRYEIVDGILVVLPPPTFDHGEPTYDLLGAVRSHFRRQGVRARVSTEVDLIVAEDRVFRVDGVLLTPEDVRKQTAARRLAGRDEARVGRVLIAPTLVVESVSEGHEQHDRVTKRRMYAGFGIPNYWIVDAAARSLRCLRLDDGEYTVDAEGEGEGEQTVRPTAFPGLEIPVQELFA